MTEGSKSLRTGLSILRAFTPQRPSRTGPEIVELMRMHKTSTYRMLAALCQEGFLERNEWTGEYSIGRSAYRVGSLYLETNSLLRAAEPVIKLMNELTGEATNLGTFENGFLTLVMHEEATHEFRWGRHVGSVMPAHTSSMGKAFLSQLSDEEIDALYPSEQLQQLTSRSVHTRTDLKAELAEIRRTGVSFDYEGTVEWVIGIGSVVRDYDGKGIGGVSMAFAKFRLDERLRDRLAGLVKRGAALISQRLGYTDPNLDVFDLPDLRAAWQVSQHQSGSHITQPEQWPPPAASSP